MRYVDVAVLSKDIHKNLSLDCKNPSPIQVLSNTKTCIKTQIDNYLKNQYPITITATDMIDNEHLGMYSKYNDRIIIDISTNLNTCQSRFVATKELMHSIISSFIPESQTTDIQKLIEHLISKDKDFKPDQEVEPEYSAWILAVELLLPYCFNDYIIDKQNKPYDIATMFKVPEIIVDRVRTEEYQNFRKLCYED